MTWSEDSIHRWLQSRRRPKGLVGSQGHDGAVLARKSGREVLCVDACVEGVHFASGATASRVGAKAAARSLSDLAACAADPAALLLALRAPSSAKESYLRGLIGAVAATGEAYGAPLVGGDLTCAPGPLALTVTALGHLSGTGRPVGRDRARPGQIVLLTGAVGGSLLGRHLDFEPRIAAGKFLASSGATVLMDVSDGLALDLARIARASRVSIQIDSLPLHRDALRSAKLDGRSAIEHGLFDGEDHELIACMPAKAWERCQRKAQNQFPGIAPIGLVAQGKGVHLGPDLEREAELPADWKGLGWIHGTNH